MTFKKVTLVVAFLVGVAVMDLQAQEPATRNSLKMEITVDVVIALVEMVERNNAKMECMASYFDNPYRANHMHNQGGFMDTSIAGHIVTSCLEKADGMVGLVSAIHVRAMTDMLEEIKAE